MRKGRSCWKMFEDVQAAVDDGLTWPDLIQLSKCCHNGKYPNNAQRDVMCKLKKLLGCKITPLPVVVQRYVKSSGKVRDAVLNVVLPHEVYAVMSEYELQFTNLFGSSTDWSAFWNAVSNEQWFLDHPLRAWVVANPLKATPYFIHCDDAPVSRRVGRSIRALSCYSPCAITRDSLDGRIALATWALHEQLVEHVDDRAKRVLSWSFRACAFGEVPIEGPEGVPLDKVRLAQAGSVLTRDGRRMIYAGSSGDLAYFAQDFQFPHFYNADQICMKCFAMQFGRFNFADSRLDAEWSRTSRPLSDYVEYILDEGLELNPLCYIPGWHPHNVYEDVTHCDGLGWRQGLNGGALILMCEMGVWGPPAASGSWRDRLDLQLASAWRDFNRFLSEEKMQASQPVFRSLTLSLKKRTNFPVLKSKSKNCVTVSLWLEKRLRRFIPGDEVVSHLYASLWGATNIWTLIHDMRPRFVLTDSEASFLNVARESALHNYYWLHVHFAELGRSMFNMTPKFHECDHMLRRACQTRLSFALVWTFASEDFMGRMAKLSAGGHGATVNSVPLHKWLLYFWSVHFPCR